MRPNAASLARWTRQCQHSRVCVTYRSDRPRAITPTPNRPRSRRSPTAPRRGGACGCPRGRPVGLGQRQQLAGADADQPERGAVASRASRARAASNNRSGQHGRARQPRRAGAGGEAGGLEFQHHAAGRELLLPQPPRQLFRKMPQRPFQILHAERSVSNVVSALIDLVSRAGSTRRASSPRARRPATGRPRPSCRSASRSSAPANGRAA